MSSELPKINAIPKTKAEEALVTSFYQDVAAQAERFDKFALELIKLQLAIPALYAAVLKLAAGGDAKENALVLGVVFTLWLLAAALSFISLFPAEKYRVNPLLAIEDPQSADESGESPLAINTYFRLSARRKLRLLTASCLLSFLGIALAIYSTLF
ncbi:MAG: hypothetical protein WAQ53_03955 [Thiofilum sp.]|uniref:hypothetical protein n=1 Tax=Thiofilum sp. TaxID=2212733 RepID=UPI0025F61474|nr:hypothetical protein [Thiofilum sp.]MBK8454845.1 hypothetical protein [Thiofilum sp.]